MRKSGFTEEQVMTILREQGELAGERRGNSRDLPSARISSAMISAWTGKAGDPEVSEAKQLKVREETAELKRLLTDAMLDGPEEDKSVRESDLPRAGPQDLPSRR